MALVPLDMQVISQATTRLWNYDSADDLSGVGYFNGMAHTLGVSDKILQNNGTNAYLWTVLSNDGTTVTVARHAT